MTQVEAVARAVLYEGYLLYPYTRGSAKNQVRWTFGGVYPPAWEADPSTMRTECLLRPGAGCRVDVRVRCLQLVTRTSRDEPPWQEAAERTAAALDVAVEELASSGPRTVAIALPGGRDAEGGVEREWRAIDGRVTVAAAPVEAGALRLTVAIENTTATPVGPSRDEALMRAMVSTHTVLRASSGEFLSLTDPPPELAPAAAACDNQGTWPVLVGEPGSRDAVLSSPIILEDHPRVAEESPGDLFDATEIDEILTLRVLTLSDAEKEELRRTDERGRELLERCESLTGEQLLRLHGRLR
jgi:hydrogenase maturation protease